jgi:ABC-type multidrug transport system ATPase subunit
VEEHLDYYVKIKGVPKKFRARIIERTIKRLQLEEQRVKQAHTLSGGNKRKLQVAIAIIGNPKIILLDEPSAGMDPEARRFMWSVVKELSGRRDEVQGSVIVKNV